jgi:hypothetical protein
MGSTSMIGEELSATLGARKPMSRDEDGLGHGPDGRAEGRGRPSIASRRLGRARGEPGVSCQLPSSPPTCRRIGLRRVTQDQRFPVFPAVRR